MADFNPRQFSINLPQESMREAQAAADAGRMYAEVKATGQRTPVKLDDPTDLQAHLVSAHEWEDHDFHRNSNWNGEALDSAIGESTTDDDYRMPHHELRKVHEFEHGAHPDWPGAVTMGDEHFHE